MLFQKDRTFFPAVAICIILIVAISGCSFGGFDAEKFYEIIKSNQPNQPGYFEDEYVDGEVLSECLVGGKYNAYYGSIRIRDTFIAGVPVNDDEPATIYVFAIHQGDGRYSFFKAGVLNVDELHGTMKMKGCEVPR